MAEIESAFLFDAEMLGLLALCQGLMVQIRLRVFGVALLGLERDDPLSFQVVATLERYRAATCCHGGAMVSA